MSTSIFDYPPVERKYVAVRRFKIINGEFLYEDLLKYLDLTEEEFIQEYGEKLIGNPSCLNSTMVDMLTGRIRENRQKRKERGL